MNEKTLPFYDELANHYHLIFEDWERSIERQAKTIGSLLRARGAAPPAKLLDCACGIGTQSLGLAAMGYRITGSDLSPAAVHRAQGEAASRSLAIDFRVSDMTSLHEIDAGEFDVVLAMDNALPHLNPTPLQRAMLAIASRIRPGGLFLASLRDYDQLIQEKPAMQPPSFFGSVGSERIVHQVWDWVAADRYVLHLYLTLEGEQNWQTHHFTSEYRCLLREELSGLLASSGFDRIDWLMPHESGFYQPIVFATRT